MTEVSGWQVDLRWAARPQSADVVAELTLRSRDQFVCQFPAFGGTWTVSSVAGAVDFDGAEVLDLVRSSVLRVDGVPDPARGFSFLVHSPAVGGIYATIRVRAGASHPTRRIAPNSITVDFSSEQFGEPVFTASSDLNFRAFEKFGRAVSAIWGASESSVSDLPPADLLG